MITISETSLLKKIVLLFLTVAGLYYAKVFLIPLCFGGILATLFLPLCNWLEKNKIVKWIAVCICLLILLAFLASFIVLLRWQIAELTNDASLLKQKALEMIKNIQDYLFTQFGITPTTQIALLKAEQPSYSNLMQLMAVSIKTVFTNLILILAYVAFILYYRGHIKEFFIKIVPASQQVEMVEMVNKAAHISHQYLVGLSKMIISLWIMYAIGFSSIGVKNALFFAILCGLLEIVPFVGNITGTILTTLFAALHGASTYMLIGIIVTYAVVQFIQSWFLEPFVLGPQVKINPFFTILVLVLGHLLWGIAGIILAIPLSGILKIIFDHIEQLKPYGFLMGELKKR